MFLITLILISGGYLYPESITPLTLGSTQFLMDSNRMFLDSYKRFFNLKCTNIGLDLTENRKWRPEQESNLRPPA